MSVDGEEISRIGEGVVALVGIGKEDTAADVEWAAKQLLGAKLFDNSDGKMWREGVRHRWVTRSPCSPRPASLHTRASPNTRAPDDRV